MMMRETLLCVPGCPDQSETDIWRSETKTIRSQIMEIETACLQDPSVREGGGCSSHQGLIYNAAKSKILIKNFSC